MQSGGVLLSEIATRQCFARVGETIHEIREEDEKLHQQGVGGQGRGAVARTYGGETICNGDEAQGAQENVAVQPQQSLESLALVPTSQVGAAKQVAIFSVEHSDGRCEGHVLCEKGAQRNACHLHLCKIDQAQTGGDVDSVLHDGKHHHSPGILHSQQPAVDAIQ